MKEKLIQHATELHGEIFPCNGDADFSNCFTDASEYGETIFWFNGSDGSTRILKESQLPN